MNDLLGISNPYYRHIPESIGNDLLGTVTPSFLHKAYSTHRINGVIVDHPEAPYYIRMAARYDLDALEDLTDGPLVFEESDHYRTIKGKAREVGKKFQAHDWLRIDRVKGDSGAQKTGDCVSWAIRCALECLRTGRIGRGQFEAYIVRLATAFYYAGRGHNGQGANPGRQSKLACEVGFGLEKLYELAGKTYDFREYSNYVGLGMRWGVSGLPDALREETKDRGVVKCYLAKTTEGVLDAMANDDTVHCGSGIGVASVGDPVSRLRGGWNHDMGMTGFDISKDDIPQEVILWDQSWGNWNRLTNIPEAWKPWTQGGFALTLADTERAVRQNGTWVFVNEGTKGFSAEPINNLLIDPRR